MPSGGVRKRKRGGALRILCFDGGGIKGLYTLMLLEALQARLPCPLVQYFDLIVGTSTGGYIAAQLLLGAPLAAIRARYESIRGDLERHVGGRCAFFTRALLGQRSLPLHLSERRLRAELGDDALLERLPRRLAIVAASADADPVAPFMLRSYALSAAAARRAPPGASGGALWRALQAATAAPVLSEACELHGRRLVDGAVVANNPAVFALAEAAAVFDGEPVELLLSLGTGVAVPTAHQPAHALGWVRMAATMLINTHLAHAQASGLLSPAQYVRLDPVGVGHFSGTEWAPAELEAGAAAVRQWLGENRALLEATAARIAVLGVAGARE